VTHRAAPLQSRADGQKDAAKIALFVIDYGKYQTMGAIMGGYGSTRWGWHSAKDTVESTPGLSVANLQKYAQIGAEGQICTGSFSWKPSGANVSYTLAGQLLTLSYSARRGPGHDWLDRRDCITLEATRPNYGGRRWWFLCPICARRCSSIYLDSGRLCFSCRQCAGLVYRSQQEHDKTLDRYARSPDLAYDAMAAALVPGKASAAQLLQAVKASEAYTQRFMRSLRKRRR